MFPFDPQHQLHAKLDRGTVRSANSREPDTVSGGRANGTPSCATPFRSAAGTGRLDLSPGHRLCHPLPIRRPLTWTYPPGNSGRTRALPESRVPMSRQRHRLPACAMKTRRRGGIATDAGHMELAAHESRNGAPHMEIVPEDGPFILSVSQSLVAQSRPREEVSTRCPHRVPFAPPTHRPTTPGLKGSSHPSTGRGDRFLRISTGP